MSSASLAQLVRAPALQAGGRRFESYNSHHLAMKDKVQKYLDFHRENGGTGKLFEFKYINYTDSCLELEGNFTDLTLNPDGSVQGGMMTSMLDDATALLLIVESEGAVYPASTDLHSLHHLPLKSGKCRVKATTMRKGKSIATVKGEIFNEANKLVTTLVHTVYLIHKSRSI